jgi:hypothetical protein
MTKAILCFCCPGTGQQKRQSSNYSPVATYGSRKNAAGAYAAAAWVKKRLLFVGIIFIYFQVGLNSNQDSAAGSESSACLAQSVPGFGF